LLGLELVSYCRFNKCLDASSQVFVINQMKLAFLLQSPFAHQVVLGYASDSSEFIEVDDDISSIHSSVSTNSSLGLSETSHSSL
jgi:hypothetical protein